MKRLSPKNGQEGRLCGLPDYFLEFRPSPDEIQDKSDVPFHAGERSFGVVLVEGIEAG
jgi:hypothetical protein